MNSIGTFLYLNSLRPASSCRLLNNEAGSNLQCDEFLLPASTSTCYSSYNDYKYGLAALPINSYVYFDKFKAVDGSVNSDVVTEHVAMIPYRDIRYVSTLHILWLFMLTYFPSC